MQRSVQLATKRFAEEFNDEVARALMAAIRVQRSGFVESSGDLFSQWSATSKFPHIVKTVYIAEKTDTGALQFAYLDQSSKALDYCDWPDQFADLKDELSRYPDEQRRFSRARN